MDEIREIDTAENLKNASIFVGLEETATPEEIISAWKNLDDYNYSVLHYRDGDPIDGSPSGFEELLSANNFDYQEYRENRLGAQNSLKEGKVTTSEIDSEILQSVARFLAITGEVTPEKLIGGWQGLDEFNLKRNYTDGDPLDAAPAGFEELFKGIGYDIATERLKRSR